MPPAARVDRAAAIVMAYAPDNVRAGASLLGLIGDVHAALASLSDATEPAFGKTEKPTVAPVKKSITPNALTSVVGGKPYKSMERHPSSHGLTPQDYRSRCGVPNNHPMVAPDYAAQRPG